MSGLAAKLRAKRESLVTLEPGKTMRIRRPAATRLGQFRHITAELAAACCVGWDGITEADLLGAEIGSSDPAPFDTEACLEVLADRREWFAKVCDGLVMAISAFLQAEEAAAKN